MKVNKRLRIFDTELVKLWSVTTVYCLLAAAGMVIAAFVAITISTAGSNGTDPLDTPQSPESGHRFCGRLL